MYYQEKKALLIIFGIMVAIFIIMVGPMSVMMSFNEKNREIESLQRRICILQGGKKLLNDEWCVLDDGTLKSLK